ncbi:MAG: hypothetical protein PVF18_05140 [Anaerolineales bacterium]|jgi:hypothetical protein
METSNPSLNFEEPYKPSWYDRFTDWLERLPGPVLGYYLVGAVVSVGIYVAVQASQGAYAGSGFFVWHIFLALQPLIVLAWMHNLDYAAAIALERFQPAIKPDKEILDLARYKFMTLPSRPAWVATIVGVLLYLVIYGPSSPDQLLMFHLSTATPSLVVVAIYFLFMWALLGLAVFHTTHQITVIRELFAKYTDPDPYNPEPLYAFSGITGRTAAILLLISYAWVLLLLQTGSMQADPVSGLSMNIFFAIFSIFIFAWPLWGAHQLLVDSKKTALAKNAALMKTVVKEVHEKIDQKKLDLMGDWQTALEALEIERTRIEKLPTWPWRPEALRGLIAALVVPVLVWFVQYLLERVLG